MNEQEYKIKGWVARDQVMGEDKTDLYFGFEKPKMKGSGQIITWVGFGDFISLPNNMFPSLSCKDGPLEVELIIKKI